MSLTKRPRWIATPLVAATLLAAAIAGCGDDDEGQAAPQSSGGAGAPAIETKTEGTLLVGADIPYVPFEFGEPPYEGFDVDLMREVGERLDLEIEFQKTPFDTIFRDLAQGRFDMVASSTVITEEREKVVDFSIPYFNADQSIMVKKGSEVASPEELVGKTVGVQIGGTGEEYVKHDLPDAERRTYDTVADAFNALAAGQIDAVINDFPSSKYAENEYPTLVVAATIPTEERYGLVYPKESTALRERIDEILREMRADGTYDSIYREWFEADPPADVLK